MKQIKNHVLAKRSAEPCPVVELRSLRDCAPSSPKKQLRILSQSNNYLIRSSYYRGLNVCLPSKPLSKKVAIIGGGICGLYLAWKLTEKGNQVTVFEKEKETGIGKVCSGLFSERILDFIPESKKLIENKINSVFLYFPKKKIKVDFSKNFFVMDHRKLDKLVFNLAEKAGAKIIFNSNITFLPKGFDRIIGCDGANSFVRKELKLPEPNFRLGILGFTEEKSNSNFVETWPCENGFIWKIPRGKKIEYGIIAKPKLAKRLFDNFLEKNNINFEKKEARIIPQDFIFPLHPSITLCGDAAGLTKSWSGGGVIWGLTAANILLKTFPDFRAYRKSMKRFFLPKIILSKIATKLVYFLGFNTPWLLPKTSKIESDFLI